jgi:hypothetical protein
MVICHKRQDGKEATMASIGVQAAELQRWSNRQRLSALKAIIPLDQVQAALTHYGRAHRSGGRVDDHFMVWFIIGLGLCCRDAYRQVYRWLVPWQKDDVPGRSTLCMARQRLGPGPLRQLARSVVRLQATAQTPGAFHRHLRLMALDGFVCNLPDQPILEQVFGRPGNQRSPGAFPQARVVGLIECGTHVFWRWQIKPSRIGEPTMARPLLKYLQEDMLLMWDRGFLGYALVQQVVQPKAHLLARIKNNRIFRPLRLLPDGSYRSRMYRTDSDRRADRHGIDVRIIEYTWNDSGRPGSGQRHRLLTTLLDEALDPARRLVELYHSRWEEELGIDELKTHQNQRPVLRSQTPAGVIQEIHGLLLGHYVLRTLMHEAARRVPISPLRLSFTSTLKILQCRLPECPRRRRARRQWYQHLLEEIAEEPIPPRRNRINPRVIKCQQSQWPKKRPEHRNWPQPKQPFCQSIVILH